MTKNHIFIKSFTLGVVLMISPLANAGNVDQVLVTFFKKLYPSLTQNCVLDDYARTNFLVEFDNKKCLDRRSVDGQQYIAGFQSPCNEKEARDYIDAQVNAACYQQAQKAQVAAQQLAKQQQQSSGSSSGSGSSGNSGSSSSGGSSTGASLKAAESILKGYAKIDKAAKKYEERQDKKEKESKESTAKAGGSDTSSQSSTGTAAKASEPQATPTASSANSSAPAATPAQRDEATKELTAAQEAYSSKYCEYEDLVVTDTCAKLKQDLDTAQGKVEALGKEGAPTSPSTTPEDTSKAISSVAPEANKAAGNLPPAGAAAGKEVVDQNADPKSDPELEARTQKAKAEDATLDAQIKAIDTALQAVLKQLPGEANAKCAANEATRDPYTGQTKNLELEQECNKSEPQKAIYCLSSHYQTLKAEQPKLKEAKESCSQNSAQAAKLCSMVRSDKAQQVQKLMSVGATILSKVTAASEACGTTSDLSKVAQGGMLLAQGACTTMKFRCDFSCSSAKKSLDAMKLAAESIQKCPLELQAIAASGPEAKQAATKLATELTKQVAPKEGAVPQAIAQCTKHKVDIAIMGVAALGFLSAFQDAESCKKQLASGGGNGGKSTNGTSNSSMTTAEYCGMPQNASSITCKCTADPNAEGCMGSIAGSGVALGKIGNSSGASAFASGKQNGLSALNPLEKTANGSGDLAPGANLSEGAREALGLGGSATAGGSVGGNAGPGLSSNLENSKGAKEDKDKPKFGFFSSIGNMLSGGKSPSSAAKAAIRGYEQDQAIKRKLASDQIRAEITTASGKSNFDKIKSRYQSNVSSFEQ